MGLIAAEIERQGITTVCVQPVRHIAERLRPPRSLVVPFPLGFPLGRPNEPALQHRVLSDMLAMVGEDAPAPLVREFAVPSADA